MAGSGGVKLFAWLFPDSRISDDPACHPLIS